MPWIRVEPEEAVMMATAKVAMLITPVISIDPKAMEAVRNMSRAIIHGASALTRVQEEAIATVVSVANKCRF